MVEQTNALLNEDNIELLGGIEDGLVILAPTWSSNVLDSGATSSEDVVDEWELCYR